MSGLSPARGAMPRSLIWSRTWSARRLFEVTFLPQTTRTNSPALIFSNAVRAAGINGNNVRRRLFLAIRRMMLILKVLRFC
jgi:hypothetical protein